jgi:hypothetical protein
MDCCRTFQNASLKPTVNLAASTIRNLLGTSTDNGESLSNEEDFAKIVTTDSLQIYTGILKFIKRLFPGGQAV